LVLFPVAPNQPLRAREFENLHYSRIAVGSKNGIVIIHAPVVDKKESLNTYHLMVFNPFSQEARFILKNGTDDQVILAAAVNDGITRRGHSFPLNFCLTATTRTGIMKVPRSIFWKPFVSGKPEEDR
jgi:hypothetical protein